MNSRTVERGSTTAREIAKMVANHPESQQGRPSVLGHNHVSVKTTNLTVMKDMMARSVIRLRRIGQVHLPAAAPHSF